MSDGVPDRDVIGCLAYARHQGVSGAAVRKAAKTGRITRAVLWGPGGVIAGIRWRLADELWRQNTDAAQALRARRTLPPGAGTSSSPGVETSGRPPAVDPAPTRVDLEHLVGKILAAAFADSLPTWPAMLVARYGLTPAIAVECVLDGLLVLMEASTARLGIEDMDFPIPAALEWRDGPGPRAQLVEAVAKLAPQIAADLQRDADAGKDLTQEVRQ